MISHYFRLARKTFLKNKYYTFINIFGLVCGMLSGLIIAKYVGGSLQFDSFHVNKDRIYSITQRESLNGNPQKESRATYYGSGELIKEYPELVSSTRYNQQIESVVQIDGENGNKVSFVENKIFATDSAFLRIFTFPLILGDSATALSRINSVVLTNSTSKRYYGKENPVGKVLTIRVPWGETMYEVTGVVEDCPKQSQFQFDLLISQPPLDPSEFWTVPEFSIFVLLKAGSEDGGLSKKLTHTLESVPQLKANNRKVLVTLQSIANVKLTNTEYLLVAVGIFIVLISWVNYINQIIAQSYLRIKEIGILRVLGSTRANLRTQFVVESSLLCLTSLLLIVVIYLILEPYLQTFTNGHMLSSKKDPSLVNQFFLTIFIIGIATAAFVPNVILFSQNFATALRNGYGSKIESPGLRKALVIIQFSISTILIIGIFVISNQLEYMRSKDKGINMENILVVKDPMPKDTTWLVKRETLESFKKRCAELPFVSEITSSSTVPGESYRHETYLRVADNDKKTLVHINGIDDRFFDLYKVKFLAGHGFIPDAKWKNRTSIILSESAAKALDILDFDKMIDTKIVDQERPDLVYNLIGIVKDYHQTSLKYEIEPMAFRFNEFFGHLSLKINRAGGSHENGLQDKLDAIKKIWDDVYHDAPFDTFLLDQKFEAQDAEDRYFGKLFKYFTILSIVVSCLGLFGLSLLVSTKRQREIGIRKTFGATSVDILTIFLKGYLGSLAGAILFGAPWAYFLMDRWVRNYSYRIEIGLGPACLAVLSLTMIFLLTVSYHTIKSSLANPVKTLRD
jgi:putative ABC transport system permease protein